MEEEEDRASGLPDDVLRCYDIVMRYLAAEAQIFWNRSQLFMVANAALVGFMFREIPVSLQATSYTKLRILLVGSVVGVFLCGLWFLAIESGCKWLDHWIKILKNWEKETKPMGKQTDLFLVGPGKHPSSRGVAWSTATLFFVTWTALAVYIAICFRLKANCIELP